MHTTTYNDFDVRIQRFESDRTSSNKATATYWNNHSIYVLYLVRYL